MRLFPRLGLALMIALSALTIKPAIQTYAAAPSSIAINVQGTGPRQVEDTTERAVSRDYAAAWQVMAEALKHNRTDALAANFIGDANEKLAVTIEDQRKNGLHQEIIDRSHQVDAVFYSPEGSAMELHDTVQVQLHLMDGDKVINSQDATLHYVVLLTAAENSWKVRVLEAVPSF